MFSAFIHFALILCASTACANIQQRSSSDKKSIFLKDVELLESTLNSAYGGYWFYFNQQIKNNLSKDLETLNTSETAEDFCYRLGKTLDSFPDGHLYAFNESHFCMPTKLHLIDVGKNLAFLQQAPFIIENRKVKKKHIGVVAIKNFTNHELKEWLGFEKQFKNLLKETSNLIIDLRGNAGGDSWFAEKMPLWIFKKVLTPYSKQQKVQTEVALQLQINSIKQQIDKLSKKGESIPQSLIKTTDYLSLEIEKSQKGLLPPTIERIFSDLPETETGTPFKEKVFILIDSYCASACEVAVLNLIGNTVTTIGSHTAGLVHFGNPGLLFLPHTKTYVAIPSDFSSLRNGKFIEKKGIIPHIVLMDGSNAYEATINLL